jgi:hypothetical protein
MKTLLNRATLLLATVSLLGQVRAAEPPGSECTVTADAVTSAAVVPVLLQRELDRQLNKHVVYPLMEKANVADGVVLVSFVIDREGRVEVIDAQSPNSWLRDYVLRRLARVDIGDNPTGTWRTTHMRFVFHPEA